MLLRRLLAWLALFSALVLVVTACTQTPSVQTTPVSSHHASPQTQANVLSLLH